MKYRDRLVRLRHRIRATRTGRLTLQIAIGVIGAVVIGVGAALIPLPGPGWFIVLAGLAIWAIEFAWAKRLLRFTRAQLERWWHWLEHAPLWMRLLAGLSGLVFVSLVVWTSVRISFGVNLIEVLGRYVSAW